MFFKNLQLYRVLPDWTITADELEQQLARRPFAPPGAQDFESRGWVSPADDGALVRTVGNHWMVCLQSDEKILPAAVVKQIAEERADELAEQQGYKLGRKAMKELREQITNELLPRAFARRRKTYAWLNIPAGWLVIDAPSQSKAEDVLEQLRHTLDQFPIGLLRTERSPTSVMTDWLSANEAPEGFTLERDFMLESIGEDGAKAAFARCDPDAAHIAEHLEAGRLPTRLALTFDDRVSFVLTQRLELKRIEFLDVVRDSVTDEDHEDAQALFDAEFALMAGELLRLLDATVDALGGELVREPDLVDMANGGADPGRSTADLRREVRSAFDNLAESITRDGGSMTLSTGDGRVLVGAGNEHDPLYPDAKRIVLEQRRPSISLVQRHLRIGYNRAARLIEQMEKDGFVSAMKADGTREVLAA